MTKLIFGGVVSSGIGKHQTLVVPGRAALLGAPVEWPEKLYPGSLNVRIDEYPNQLAAHGLDNRVSELDRGEFAPAFEIPRAAIGNNHLGPRPEVPRGGDAQVWKAVLLRGAEAVHVPCWALRRFGSQVGEQLEFVAEHRLRDFDLNDGLRLQVVLLGAWRLTVDPEIR